MAAHDRLKRCLALVLLLGVCLSPDMPRAVFSAEAEASEGAIQDNSFLIEEAYNQEDGVVQHINAFFRSTRSGDWMYTFTQEWPAGGLRHQVSFTLPVQRLSASGAAGLGDMALNYRYQLIGDGDATVAVSPRISVLAPTGDEKKAMGAGAAGVQVNLPVSIVVGKNIVTHWNAGATYTPSAVNDAGVKADTKGFNLGQSTIWLVRGDFNALLEVAWSSFEFVDGPGETGQSRTMYLSPGIRWAYDFPSGLQIVPGIAVPIGVGPSRNETAVFFYLSFEHPIKRVFHDEADK